MQRIFTSFAAANGYGGFRSYFNDVFNSKDFVRIFVLKGGPGTGKSSFMKRLRDDYSQGCFAEEILCSSDPDSLDGIILERDGVRVAVLDGTAPHERDAVVAGAIDEIVNLGELWDSAWLTASREKILMLGEQKAAAYKTAYSYLEVAGAAAKIKKNATLRHFDKEAARRLARELICESSERGRLKTRLFSSFGKRGEYRLNTPQIHAKRPYSLDGDKLAASLLLGALEKEVRERSLTGIIAPSPLDPDLTDTVYLSDGTAFTLGGSGEKINADAFLADDPAGSAHTNRANEIRKTALDEAERWFKIAADMHAELEKIYTSAMDFTKIEPYLSAVGKECEKILSLS